MSACPLPRRVIIHPYVNALEAGQQSHYVRRQRGAAVRQTDHFHVAEVVGIVTRRSGGGGGGGGCGGCGDSRGARWHVVFVLREGEAGVGGRDGGSGVRSRGCLLKSVVVRWR